MRPLLLSLLLLIQLISISQDGYKTPPKDVSDMLMAKRPPNVSVDDKGEWMLFMESSSYPSVAELARPELRIAGLRINPANFAPSRQTFILAFILRTARPIKNIRSADSRLRFYAGSVSWSGNNKKIAFTHTTDNRVDLYIIDVATQKATCINKTALNSISGTYSWYDENTVLYRGTIKPFSAAPPKPAVPDGPTIQENYGKAAPRPTYQDLIKSPYDEQLYAFYATTQLIKNTNGIETKIGQPAIYSSIVVSPDKKFMLIRTLRKPFSYAVPAGGFPALVTITDMNGKLVKQLAELPSAETAPSGYDNVQPFARGFEWRDDEPSTIVWCMPLDSGLIKKQVEYHDAVYAQKAPFTGEAELLFKTKMRFSGIVWGTESLAIVTEGLRSKQLTQVDRYHPVTGDLEKLITRNTTDAYSSPGFPVTHPNQYGKNVLWTIDNGNKILLNNSTGSSPKGDLPFLISYDVHKKKADTIWRCAEGYFENVVKVLDAEKGILLTSRESEKEVPNYWIRNTKLKMADRQLTRFGNPYPQMDGVTKEKIKYKRADGVDLTGDLYLPKGYNKERDGKLPVIIWAYPAEYNSAADAAQIRGSEHRYTMVGGGSPVFYVTQGYAVLNNAEMPIVASSKDKKPNDDFIQQLTMNAEAAINTLDSMGVGDRNKMAVGGHSYGAFMTANLLAHTSLFKAGIARSGAYNRSLTPFGFQNEDRTYWQATDLYNNMSPFNYADKIKTPLLLIHGEMDNNTGTFPIQSERMYNAVKGHGGTARFVSLPYESHGYAGKENLLHVLAEQFEWMEKYVKGNESKEVKGGKEEKKGF